MSHIVSWILLLKAKFGGHLFLPHKMWPEALSPVLHTLWEAKTNDRRICSSSKIRNLKLNYVCTAAKSHFAWERVWSYGSLGRYLGSQLDRQLKFSAYASFFDFVKPLKIWAYLDNFFFHSFQGGTKEKMLKNCQNYTLVFQHFSFGPPLETMKKKVV